MSVSGTCLRVNRAAFLAFAIAFCSALVLLATTANRADASFAITDFTLTPSTTQAGGHPNTHYHVDPDAPLADRTDGDDLKKVTIDFPAGLLANPEAANPKCTTSQFSSDKCPSTSYIGSMSVKWRERSWLWSTTASAAGSVYILTPATAGSAVTVGFILRPSGYRKIYLKTEVTGVVTVRSGTDADYGLTLVVDNIPRTMVTTGGSTKNITINDITVDINARANTSKTGPYFAFNPTRCTAANTRATITSYKNVVVTRNSSFTPSGCENVPFSATANVVPANPAPGASTAVSATFTTPTADAPIQNSHVAAIQVDLPEGTNLDFPAIAAIPATCTEAQVNADSCPAGSKIGTVSAAVPFLPPTMTGDVYLINRNNGILFGYVLRGSNGVKAALKGQAFTPDIDGDGSADLVRTIASNMPQAPWSSATINFSAALVKNPTACGMHTVSSTIHGWSGASVSQTNQWSDNGACDVTPPVVNITSPADGSSTTASSITLHFTATDDSGTTPSCDTTSGSSVALALGANTIAVTCTDSMGNSGSDSVTVNRKTFSPTYNQTVSNPVAGENTGLTIEFSSTGANASAISRAQAKTGAALPLDTAAIGDAAVDMCPTESLSGTGASATFDATACPPQALVGTASFTSSQLGAPMLGEIYLIEKSAIPHFGIKPVGSNGLSLVVFGDVTQFDPGCDPNAAPCDYTVQMTTSQLPNFGDSTLSLTFDAPDRVSDNGYPLNGKIFKIASAADNVCDGSLDSVGTMIPSATGSAVTDSDSDAIDCAGSDTTPPVVNITSPADGSSTAASSVTLTYTATDDSGDTPTCSPANNASVALNIGSNTIAVSCADSAGNTGSDSVTVIRIDNIAPTIGGLNCTLVGSYSCLLTYTASDNSGSVTCTPPSGTVIALTPGANTITVNCSDPSGNVSTASLTITISAPALTVAITDGPPNGGVTNDSTPTFTYQSNQQVWQQPYCPPGQVCVQVIQQVIGFRCTIDGGAPVECPANLTYGGQYTTPPLSDAPHTFCVTAYYTNGSGQSAPDCRTFEVHSGPPVFAITSPVNNSQTLAASTTVNYSQPSGATCTPANGSSVPLTVGANTITVSCTDAVGNVGTASVTVYRKTFAPTYNQTVSNPVAGQNTGLTIEFSSTGANAAAIRIAQATTGAALAPDTSAFGDYYYDQCPTSSIVGSGNTAMFDSSACPAQAKVGTATLSSPQLGSSMQGEIYMISRAPIPNFGIKAVGGSGLNFVVTSSVVNFDPACDPLLAACDASVQLTTSNMPNVGDSTVSLTFDGPDRAGYGGVVLNGKIFKLAQAEDSVCDGSLNSRGTMLPWPTGTAVTDTDSDPIDCVPSGGDTMSPVVTITSPIDNAVTSGSSIAVTYTVTDNLDPTPTCDKANGSSQPLTAGTNTITVTCVDDAGNSGSDSVTVIRTTPIPSPDPNCAISGTTLTCTWTQPANVTPTCQLDMGPATTCTPPVTYAGLSSGPHTFTLCFTDIYGNVSCATYSFTIVIEPAAITSYANPSAGTPASGPASPAPIVTFGNENPAYYECRVDAGAWSSCSSPWTIPTTGLTSPAEHSYEIRTPGGTLGTGYFWYDNRTFNATATATAVPNSLEPTAADANDAGAHPNITATLSLEGYDDPKSASVIGPDGLMGSLRSIPENSRCTVTQADAGTCPASSLIGTAVGTGVSATDGTVTANGNIYLVDAAGLPSTDAAGVALEFENITGPIHGNLGNVIVRGSLRINDQARNIRLVANDIPRQTSNGVRVHMLNGSITINGDTRPDMSAPPSETNPPLITNQHRCTTPGTHRPNFNKFVGTGTGYNGSVIPTVTATYAVDNCAAVPFNPTIGYSLTSVEPGTGTVMTADMSMPFDHSPTAAIQVTLPPFLSANTAAFGDTSVDQCPVETIVNASPVSTPVYNYFDYDNPSFPCPPQARVGEATITTPLLDGTVTGTVWLIEKAPIPNIGIVIDADTPGNPQGVNIGLVGTTATVQYVPTCDPLFETCDQSIRAVFNAMPDVPLSTVQLKMGTVPGRVDGLGNPLQQHVVKIAAEADSVCHPDEIRTTLVAMRGTPNVSRAQMLTPNCGLPTNEPPQLSFISLPSYTNQSPVTVNYTATDDSGTTPTCNPASGFTFPLVEGLNTVSVTCTDNEGASSTWTRSVRLDTQPPTINFMQCGSSPTAQSSCTLSFGVTDNNPLGSSPCQPVNGTNQPLTIGTNTITVTCSDQAGNSASGSVAIERVALPTVSLSCTPGASSADCTFSATGGIPPYTFTCQIDSEPASACSSPSSISLTPGPHLVVVCVTDSEGNVACNSVSVVIGPSGLETSIVNATPPSTRSTDPMNVTFVTSPNGSTAECRVDSGAWSTCTAPWTVPLSGFTTPGEHSFEVRAVFGSTVDESPEKRFVWVDDRAFNAVPTVTAVPNSLEPTAADANDAGAHPNITATLSLEGYDDPKSANVIGPDGLMGSLRSIPENSRCSMAQADAGTCPPSSLIGTATATATTTTDGAVTANGNIYLVDAAGLPASDAAGVAVEFENITGPVNGDLGNVVARGGLRINDQARNLRAVIDDIPRQTSGGVRFHLRSGSLTINGDTRPDMGAPPSETNPPLITNQHICASPGASRPNFNKFVGTGKGYDGSTTPTITATYAVDNCAALPFSPTINYEFSDLTAGAGTELKVTASVPYDHSTLRAVQVVLPPFAAANTAAFGDASMDQCPVEAIVNASPPSTPTYNYFDYENPSYPCPAQARVGSATITSPLLESPITGTVWLIEKAPIPNIGVAIDADAPGNPQGVNIGLIGTTATVSYVATCDPLLETCDQAIQSTFASLPDVPLSTMVMELGTVPGRVDSLGNPLQQHMIKIAAAADSVCRNAGDNVRTLLVPWRGTPNASRTQLTQPTGCLQ